MPEVIPGSLTGAHLYIYRLDRPGQTVLTPHGYQQRGLSWALGGCRLLWVIKMRPESRRYGRVFRFGSGADSGGSFGRPWSKPLLHSTNTRLEGVPQSLPSSSASCRSWYGWDPCSVGMCGADSRILCLHCSHCSRFP